MAEDLNTLSAMAPANCYKSVDLSGFLLAPQPSRKPRLSDIQRHVSEGKRVPIVIKSRKHTTADAPDYASKDLGVS